jgi:hypothetical protein
MNPSLHFSARLAALVIAAPLALAAPIARYALDGTADDSSGNDFHGVVNGATFVEDAQRGTVAAFNGTSGSIDVSASGFSITERPNFQFALSFWFKPEERDDYAPGGAIDVPNSNRCETSSILKGSSTRTAGSRSGLPLQMS